MKKFSFIFIVLALLFPSSAMALSCVPPVALEELIQKPDPYTHVFYGKWQETSGGKWEVEIEGAWVWPGEVPQKIQVVDQLHRDWPVNIKDGDELWVAAIEQEDGELGISQCSSMGAVDEIEDGLIDQAEDSGESAGSDGKDGSDGDGFFAWFFAMLRNLFW